MTERSSSHGQPDEWHRYAFGDAGQQYPGQYPGQGAAGQEYYGQPLAGPEPGEHAMGPTRHSATRPRAQSQGFLGALFDFSFSSFITTTVIKVLYALVVIVTVLSALVFTYSAFKANATFGVLTLVIGDPLFVIIVLALWRISFEACIVFFRMAEDIRALRERGETR